MSIEGKDLQYLLDRLRDEGVSKKLEIVIISLIAKIEELNSRVNVLEGDDER